VVREITQASIPFNWCWLFLMPRISTSRHGYSKLLKGVCQMRKQLEQIRKIAEDVRNEMEEKYSDKRKSETGRIMDQKTSSNTPFKGVGKEK
jgi:hypothetical protein